MGARSVRMPDVGEGMAEAEIVEWHVKVGDDVREDQVVAAVMTDKATVEIPAPAAGKVLMLGADVGQMIAIGAELIRIDVPGQPEMLLQAANEPAAAERNSAAPALPIAPAPAAAAPVPDVAVATPASTVITSAAQPARAAGGPALPRPVGEAPLAPPAVRKRALDAGIDLRRVAGSGPAGRISHADLDGYIAGSASPVAAGSARRGPDLTVETIPVIGLRRRIAQNMAESKRRVAHFSYVEEVDVTALEELRAKLNAEGGKEAVKLTILPFLMLAITRALRDFPQMNAHYDDEANIITRHGAAHLGIATQTPQGLMVPVVHHVETLSLWECAGEVRRLSEAARDGKAGRDELSGSTLTITSLGALGGVVTTPVINRPEVAIIGVNKLMVKPVWQETGFVPRKVMNLSSSFDHRVIDGYDAALFIQRIRALVETPALIFVER